jgi:hypothetical protein
MLESIADEACHWLSEGSREVYGMLLHVTSDRRGLRIHLDNGKSVVWRCSSATASLVLSNLVTI